MIDLKDHWYHKLPGGVIGETGPHISYMSLEFLKNIKNVDVFAKNFLNYPWAPYDDFRIEIEGENGFSSVALAYTNDYWAATVDIIGTKAMLQIDLNSMLLIKHDLNELSYIPIAKQTLGSVGQRLGNTISKTANVISGRQKIGTELVVEKFAESILNGTPLPVTAEDGLEATRLMEMIVKNYYLKYASGIKMPNEDSITLKAFRLLFSYKTFRDTYNFLKKSQSWDENRLEEYQFEQLSKLLNHSYENVPYYTRIFDERGLKTSDIQDFKDLRLLPYLTKDLIRNNLQDLKAKNFPENKFEYVTTGGTFRQASRILL